MISLKIRSTQILMENLFLLAITLLSTAFAERVQDTLQELFQSMNKLNIWQSHCVPNFYKEHTHKVLKQTMAPLWKLI